MPDQPRAGAEHHGVMHNDAREVQMQKREWVVGFLFDDRGERVLLIRKNRPEWQAGKLNGVGGKVEQADFEMVAKERGHSLMDHDLDDAVRYAMVREFEEEAGVATAITGWHHFASLTWEEGVVHFLRGFSSDVMSRAQSMTDEPLEWHSVERLNQRDELTPNLLWLVPLAAHRHDTYDLIDVVETGTTLRKPGRLDVLPGSPRG